MSQAGEGSLVRGMSLLCGNALLQKGLRGYTEETAML